MLTMAGKPRKADNKICSPGEAMFPRDSTKVKKKNGKESSQNSIEIIGKSSNSNDENKNLKKSADTIRVANFGTTNPDDTYAKVCTLGKVKDPNVNEEPKSEDCEEAPASDSENEGWNPLFYKPLIPCPHSIPIPYPLNTRLQINVLKNLGLDKNGKPLNEEQSASTSKKQNLGDDGSHSESTQEQSELFQKSQRLPFWLIKEQAEFWQRELKERKRERSLNQKNTQTLFNTQRQKNTSAGDETKSWLQPPQQSLHRKLFESPFDCNFKASASIPLPTLTPKTFSSPYLWSVDASNPFWLIDQRPNLETNIVNNRIDPFGLDLLPPKTKQKKESRELVNAIKIGVGIIDNESLEDYFFNMSGSGQNLSSKESNKSKAVTTSTGKNSSEISLQNGNFTSDSDSEEFLSGIADTDIDNVDDSFKSCLEKQFNWDEWKSFRSNESENHPLHESLSSNNNNNNNGASKSFVTSDELERLCGMGKKVGSNDGTSEMKKFFEEKCQLTSTPTTATTTKTSSCYNLPNPEEIHNNNHQFNMEEARSKLQDFDLYIEDKPTTAMETQGEYTLEAMKELINSRANNRAALRGIIPVNNWNEARNSQNIGGFGSLNNVPGHFYSRNEQAYNQPLGEKIAPQLNQHNDLENMNSLSSVQPFYVNWELAKLFATEQQQQQQQQQHQQYQQQQRQIFYDSCYPPFACPPNPINTINNHVWSGPSHPMVQQQMPQLLNPNQRHQCQFSNAMFNPMQLPQQQQFFMPLSPAPPPLAAPPPPPPPSSVPGIPGVPVMTGEFNMRPISFVCSLSPEDSNYVDMLQKNYVQNERNTSTLRNILHVNAETE